MCLKIQSQYKKVQQYKMINRNLSPPVRIVAGQPIQTEKVVYRSKSPQPPVYYEQRSELRQRQEDQLRPQPSGGNPSISFGLAGSSSVKINAYPVSTPDGTDYYEGDLNQNGEFHGTGKYYYTKNNHEYHGQFQRGKPHGRGILYKRLAKINNNSTVKSAAPSLSLVYQGQWRNGMKNGQGKYFYNSQNHYYQGPWVNDQRHGNSGTYVSPMGKYVGKWQQGRMEGRGEFYVARTGTKYQGNFQNNQLVDGVIIYPNKDEYKGRVRNGLRDDNQGRYAYNRLGEQADQVRYFGGWKNDIKTDKSGQATITFLNGQTFKGIYDENKFIDTAPFEYQWPDGETFHGWLQKIGNNLNLKGVVKKPNGKQYEV